MRRLILIRHARALRAGFDDDFERPLAPEGRDDAALLGRVLAREGLAPDRVLVSAALRARETWEALGAAFPLAAADVRRELYLADAPSLLDAIEDEADEADTLMVVAHNPGVHSLAAALMRRDSAPPSILAKLERGFPTSTAAVFAIDAAGRAAYDGLILVAEHGGAGAE